MKKAILISIRPEWVAKILNGEKTIEIRKTAPKCELPIDVYIYCSYGNVSRYLIWSERTSNYIVIDYPDYVGSCYPEYNGFVVAKFTLNKIENFINGMNELEREWDGKPDAEYDYFAYEKALEEACLTYEEAEEYCPDQSFFAWHISNLQIFDEPKDLSDFGRLLYKGTYSKADYLNDTVWEGRGEIIIQQEKLTAEKLFTINRAPQSWQYVEVEE